MTDPKDDKVTIPPKSTSPSPTPTKTASATSTPSVPAKSTPASKVDTRTMSSVGAELHPDASVKKVDGKVTLDAGGSHPAAAPQPTPAEAVLYPSTGGLPDTGPNSKYVLGTDAGPELYNRDGQRVNADGQLIDDFGAVIPDKGSDNVTLAEDRRVSDKNMQRQERYMPQSTKDEMEAGRRALANR